MLVGGRVGARRTGRKPARTVDLRRYGEGMSLTLPARGRAVLAHLLTDRYAGHTIVGTAAATGLARAAVTSTFTLLVTCGWAVWRDAGAGRVLALTSIGRAEGPAAVAAGVPLRQLDAEDPGLADRVRRQLGWAPRHVTA